MLVTNGDPAGFSFDQHALHALSLCQAITDTTDRAIFTIAGLFPTPGNTTGHTTHTQRDSCVVERRFNFWDTTSERSSLFSA